ncbi:hypothetical protein [Hymenobacter nivis]|uniref:Uncharacterized protein n=1 Tax=Hymenobacter nivis TaxID=1850093 RepID=A0A2Z3GEK3_9BACT|nr:hypothetical protein [Hymenobacter nivis]AWM32119.1 hypothetical protein DDQ68_04505 [Hymenobacter nivis]
MTARTELVFKLKGQRNGSPISPDTWDVAELKRFIGEVEDLLRPETTTAAERAEEPITLRYEEGSAQLRTRSSRSRQERALRLVQALRPLRTQDAEGNTVVGVQLEALLPKQRRVIHTWFQQAQAYGDVYQVLDPQHGDQPLLIIDRYTTLVEAAEDLWLPTELYLSGRILSLGGVNKTGLTIEVGQNHYKVAASEQQLAQQEANLVYHEVVMRVKAERQYKSGDLRNLELGQFVKYAPTFDKDSHANATRAVSKAFAGIDSLTDWVSQLRGE